jgi:hypothetical protein
VLHAVAMEQVCVKCFIKKLRALSWSAKVLFVEREVTFDTLHPSPPLSGLARGHFDLFRRPSFISTKVLRFDGIFASFRIRAMTAPFIEND